MIAYLNGTLANLQPSTAIVECGGVGYWVHISLNTFAALKDAKQVKLLTHYQVKETEHVIYGFTTPRERSLFQQLLSVSGIGGTTALAILSSLRPEELEAAIRDGDVKRIQSVKGVGPKTAGRVVLELKGRLPSAFESEDGASADSGAAPLGRIRQEALDALASLGFPRQTMEKRVDDLLRAPTPPQSVEALIKAALKG